jgi:hypothetical protein
MVVSPVSQCPASLVVASNTGRLIARFGLRPVMVAGYAVIAVGLGWLSLRLK